MRTKIKYIQLSLSVVLFFISLATIAGNSDKIDGGLEVDHKCPHIIIEHQPAVAKSEKEALLILPGFSDNKRRRKKQKAFFEKLSYDLYIPDYHSRASFDLTVANFQAFYEAQGLAEYKKVHVFSYIIGSWTLNQFIEENGQQNISTIIYNRSPLQERAARVAVDKMPLISKMMKGKVLKDFSETPYPCLKKGNIAIGIIVESKATKLIRFYKKKTLSYGPIRWDAAFFQQEFDDLIYTPLNHSQMYTRFDIIGADIIHFLEYGQFNKTARRIPYKWDYFKKWKDNLLDNEKLSSNYIAQ